MQGNPAKVGERCRGWRLRRGHDEDTIAGGGMKKAR